ncbi:hypothetical protein ACFLRC_04395 [Candidatus Altiarchaeota archaeon]
MEEEKKVNLKELKYGLADLKNELTATRLVLEKSLEHSNHIESKLLEVHKMGSKYQGRLTEMIDGKEERKELDSYRNLLQKGVTVDNIKQRLISRGHQPEKVEALLEVLDKKRKNLH